MRSDAYLSPDRVFRYWLLRVWDEALPLYCVIGANPSTADETEDDPTIRKVIGFGRSLGYGGALMLNVGAFRATDPKDWKAASDPFGPENTVDHLQRYIDQYSPALVVAAWGKPVMSSERGKIRASVIKRKILGMKCWGMNADWSPRHPLMLSYSTPLKPFN